MHTGTEVIAGVGLADRPRKSRWPARMDLTQSVSGLVLGLFMWGHMFFVSSILVSKDVDVDGHQVVRGLLLLRPVVSRHRVGRSSRASSRSSSLHAFLAMRKFPAQLPPVPDLPRAHAD